MQVLSPRNQPSPCAYRGAILPLESCRGGVGDSSYTPRPWHRQPVGAGGWFSFLHLKSCFVVQQKCLLKLLTKLNTPCKVNFIFSCLPREVRRVLPVTVVVCWTLPSTGQEPWPETDQRQGTSVGQRKCVWTWNPLLKQMFEGL